MRASELDWRWFVDGAWAGDKGGEAEGEGARDTGGGGTLRSLARGAQRADGRGITTFDLVLVADCIYYAEGQRALVETLRRLATGVVLVAYEDRYDTDKPELLKRFLKDITVTFLVEEVGAGELAPEYTADDLHVLRLTRLPLPCAADGEGGEEQHPHPTDTT